LPSASPRCAGALLVAVSTLTGVEISPLARPRPINPPIDVPSQSTASTSSLASSVTMSAR